MSDITEDEVKKELGIDSWRNLSKDGVMELAKKLPTMSKDVALSIAEAVPDFRLLATETLNAVNVQLKTALKSNSKSHKRAQKAYERVHDLLARELERPDLTPEDRRDLYDRILEVADKVAAKDSQGKQFAIAALTITIGVVGTVIVAAAKSVTSKGGPSA